MLGVMGYLTGFSCLIILLHLIFYFFIFAVNVDFRSYNLIRQGPQPNSDIGKGMLFKLFLGPLIGLVCLAFLKNWIGIFYTYEATFNSSYNNPVFVFLIAIFMGIALTSSAQQFFFSYLVLAYVLHKKVLNFIQKR